MIILASVVFMVVGALPAAGDWKGQAAYDAILGLTRESWSRACWRFLPRVLQLVILAKMKILTKGRYLWTRTIGSTLVGEAVDTALFVTVAFWGVLGNDLLLAVIVSNYIFKVGVEVLFHARDVRGDGNVEEAGE